MLKLLFYGFRHGHINGLYQKATKSEDFSVVGCIEENAEARARAEKNLGITFSEQSYEAWLSQDIDAVAIGLAYGDRGRAIIRALRAGKHVIADKPICTKQEELDEIERLAKEKNLTVGCMLDLRYLPATQRAKEILDSGRLGEVRNVTFTGQHCIDYANRPAWYFEKGMHGGTVNDLAIHGIDLVRMLTGKEIEGVDAVRTWNSYADRNPDFKDCALLMARLSGGAGVLADVSYSAPSSVFSMPTYWEFRIWCAKGLLSFSACEGTVTLYEEGVPTPQKMDGKQVSFDYLTEFYDAVTKADPAMRENLFASTRATLYLQSIADKGNE